MSDCRECARRRTAIWHAGRTVRDRARALNRKVESGRLSSAMAAEAMAVLKADADRCRARLVEHEAECTAAVAS